MNGRSAAWEVIVNHEPPPDAHTMAGRGSVQWVRRRLRQHFDTVEDIYNGSDAEIGG